jgi:hypothetical protein
MRVQTCALGCCMLICAAEYVIVLMRETVRPLQNRPTVYGTRSFVILLARTLHKPALTWGHPNTASATEYYSPLRIRHPINFIPSGLHTQTMNALPSPLLQATLRSTHPSVCSLGSQVVNSLRNSLILGLV